jgi:DNA-binding response OmpR family regulator
VSGTILIADDEDDVLGLLRIHLTRLGYEIVEARNGAEALRLALERRPALAVLDVSMPELDGLEVTRRLRADERAAGLPIVLLSARVHHSDVERGLAAGASAYLGKPFSGEELRAQIEELLTYEPR